MKVTVKDYLNVRVGKPSVNAPTYQYLAPGSIIEVDDNTYNGDKFEGVDTWVKDEGGNYYWSGGIHGTKQFVEGLKSDYWYEKLDVGQVHRIEKGDKSTVLILDTGLNEDLNPFENVLSQPVKNFVPGSNTTRSRDNDSHGTHCAGLIAARPDNFLIGSAPESKLLVGKVSEYGKLQNADTLKNALREFLNEKYIFDVISISQCVFDEDKDLEDLIRKHVQKNRIVVSAIGNDSLRNNSNFKRYPGYYDLCLSVGAAEIDETIAKYTCFPSKANIFCFGSDIKSYKENNYPLPLTGTSQSTAIVAGVCALIISFLKKNKINYEADDIKKLLIRYSTPLKGEVNYKQIQPKLIFDALLKFKRNGKNTTESSLSLADIFIS